jgi:hypothetical protein
MRNLTYWEDPPYMDKAKDPDAYDGIRTIHDVKAADIWELVRQRPNHCTMVSIEHSYERTLKSGRKTNFFKVLWEGPARDQFAPRPHCKFCNGTGRL